MFVRGAFQLGFLPSKPSFGNIALNSCYTEENSQLTWGFSRERKKKINMLPKLAYRSNHIVKWQKKKNDKEVRVLTTGYSQLVTHPVSNPVRPLLIYCTSLARSFKRSRNPSTSASASSTSVALSFNSVASSSIDALK